MMVSIYCRSIRFSRRVKNQQNKQTNKQTTRLLLSHLQDFNFTRIFLSMSTDNYFIRILDKKISKEEFTQSEILQDACGTDDKGK